LHLTLVDVAGSSPPSDRTAHAAIDSACDNTTLAGGKLESGKRVWTNQASDFLWFHGDQHGCDHMKMGPSGHQGVVTVTAVSGDWTCTASINGSNLSTRAVPGPTAKCRKTAAAVVAPGLINGLAQVDKKLDDLIGDAKVGKASTKQIDSRNFSLRARLTALIEDHGSLGELGASGVDAGDVFRRLVDADIMLRIAAAAAGGGRLKDVPEHLEDVAAAFAKLAALTKAAPGLDGVSADFAKLGDATTQASRDFKSGKLKPGQVEGRTKRLVAGKHALIGQLPAIYGIATARVYRLYEQVLAEFKQVDAAASNGDLAGSIKQLTELRSAKQKLETAFKNARGK
jgi:hypothetical protein